MIDIHHHLLYGIDDGPATIEESIVMAKMAVEDGITRVVCTPHASDRYSFNPQENAARMANLRAALEREDVPLLLGQGCDFHINRDNLKDAKENRAKYTINGKQYLLIEFLDHCIPIGLEKILFELGCAGLIAILTHPERNLVLQRSPDRMKQWIENGLLIQVTAASVLGRFGKKAQSMAKRLLDDRWVHVLATDAHSSKGRPPRMRECFEQVANSYGQETATRLCVTNPGAIFRGDPLGAQPEPIGVGDDEWTCPPKRSWISHLFSK
jgi:protein-tyrosine phosphatase